MEVAKCHKETLKKNIFKIELLCENPSTLVRPPKYVVKKKYIFRMFLHSFKTTESLLTLKNNVCNTWKTKLKLPK